MKMILEFAGRSFVVRSDRPIDCSILLTPDGPQVNAFGAPPAHSNPFTLADFTGDTRKGGSVNCEVITINPHCNSTHTEGVGHITVERIPLTSIFVGEIIPALVISVEPTAPPDASSTELVIVSEALEREYVEHGAPPVKALVVRTLPNDVTKRTRRYAGNLTPYFTLDAAQWLVEKGIVHLVCDLPSLDRASDDGKLAAHRAFWELPKCKTPTVVPPSLRTITELAYIPSSAPDGLYLLNLVPAPIASDASLSRPLLYTLSEVSA